jgi:hypothetical protein
LNVDPAGTNMYSLGPDEVYEVKIVTPSAWVPEGRIWAPEVFHNKGRDKLHSG